MRDSSFANWFGSSSFSTLAPRSSLTVVSRMTEVFITCSESGTDIPFSHFEMVCLTTWRRDANSYCERSRSFRFNWRFSWNMEIHPFSKDFMHSLAETGPLRKQRKLTFAIFMGTHSFFCQENLEQRNQSIEIRDWIKPHALPQKNFCRFLRPFFKNLSQIFGKMRFPSLQAAEGEIRRFMVGAERELPE